MPSFNYAAARAAGRSDQEINAYLAKRRSEGVNLQVTGQRPESLVKANPIIESITGATGGKQISRLVGALGFMASGEKKAADQSQQQLDALTQKYVRETLAKFPPGDPRRDRALKLAQEGYGDTSSFQEAVANTGPTGRELAADVGKLSLTGLGLKIPANFPVKLALTRSVGAQSALGGGFGSLNALEAGKSPREALGAAGMGALSAGALRGATGLTGRLFTSLTRGGATRFANSALAEPARVRVKGIRAQEPSLGEELLHEGYKLGSTKSLAGQFERTASNIDDNLTTFLASKANARQVITKAELKPYLSSLFREAKQALGETDARLLALKKIIADAPDSMRLPQANELKRTLYRAAKNAYTNPNAGVTPQGQKTWAAGIRKLIEDKTVQKNSIPLAEFQRLSPANQTLALAGKYSPVQEINRRLGVYSRAGERLAMRAAQRESAGTLNLRDIALAGGGFMGGGPTGAIMAPLAARLLSSPAGKLAIAKVLYGMSQGGARIDKQAIMEAIRRLVATGSAEGIGRVSGQ